MKNKFTTKKLLPLLLVFICLFLYASALIEKNNMVQKRKVLADLMSVSLEQYPYFPDDYFPEKLIEGMSIEEVHRIMIGYEKVYNSSNCSEDSSCYEVYYYFSTDENKADRIQIMYDENFAIQKIMQEDNNSKTLTTNGWDEGLIER